MCCVQRISWDINLNFSRNKNELISLSNDKWTGENMKRGSLSGAGSFPVLMPSWLCRDNLWEPFYGKKFIGIKDGKEQFANDGESEIIGCAQPDFLHTASLPLCAIKTGV